MLDFEEGSDERSIVAPGFRLRFRWVGDRWSHAFEVGEGPHRTIMAESYEADVRDDALRVSSPTFQEISLQRDADSAHALLVGRSGPHHFSAAFQVRSVATARQVRTTIQVDVADRCRAPIEALASTYLFRVAPHGITQRWPPRLVRFEIAPDGIGLLSATRVDLADAGPRGVLAQIVATLATGQGTQRLLYFWFYRTRT